MKPLKCFLLTSGFVWLFGGGLPADLCHVGVEGEDAVVLAAVGAHLDQLAARLHVRQTVLGCKYKTHTFSGLQLRKSEQNGFHDNFLISQPNPLM